MHRLLYRILQVIVTIATSRSKLPVAITLLRTVLKSRAVLMLRNTLLMLLNTAETRPSVRSFVYTF